MLTFVLDASKYEVTVEPDSVFTVITKIGALLGLMRVFSLLTTLHEWQFEKKLAKGHG